VKYWEGTFQFSRRIWLLALTLSFILQIILATRFPLTVDELHLWNIMKDNQSVESLLDYIRYHETHFPIFYLFSFFFYNSDHSPLILRLPSLLLGFSSIFLWQKVFNYDEEKNVLPWLLVLFCPFILLYKSLYLTYSLLIFTSILAYTSKKFSILFSLPQGLSHYYGLFAFLLRFIIERPRIKKTVLIVLLLGVSLIIYWFGILDKIFHFHSYRQFSSPLKIFGFFNLLLGGLASTSIIIYLHFKNIRNLGYRVYIQSYDFIFLTIFILVVALFTSLINPVAEARYFLVLLVPLYRLLSISLTRRTALMILTSQVLGAYLLFSRFGPSFMIDYKKVPALNPNIQTGILVTPCPRYFYRESHIRCLDYYMTNEEMWSDNELIIVHQDHYPFFISLGNKTHACKPFASGLLQCAREENK
jgi:hypothetical protein